ncbi:hypothetical protein [Burkholderia glumae]
MSETLMRRKYHGYADEEEEGQILACRARIQQASVERAIVPK